MQTLADRVIGYFNGQTRPANRKGWLGQMDFAEAGTPDRWGAYEDAWVKARRALAVGFQTYLPTTMPYPSAWAACGCGTPDELLLGGAITNPYGVGERPNPGMAYAAGDYYQGWVPNANYRRGYAAPAAAIGQPVLDPSAFYYSGDLPMQMAANVNEPPPWFRGGLYG